MSASIPHHLTPKVYLAMLKKSIVDHNAITLEKICF